jgi:hypothetical protein
MFHFLVASQTLDVSLCPDDSNGNEDSRKVNNSGNPKLLPPGSSDPANVFNFLSSSLGDDRS